MCQRRLLSLLVCSTFIVDVRGSHFFFLNVVFVLVLLTCLVSVIGVSPSVSFWCLSDCVVVISCRCVCSSSVSFWFVSVCLVEMCCTL